MLMAVRRACNVEGIKLQEMCGWGQEGGRAGR